MNCKYQHPHKARKVEYQHRTGGLSAMIHVRFPVPSRVAALLPEEAEGLHIVHAANISEAKMPYLRNSWGQPSEHNPPMLNHYHEAVRESADSPIEIRLHAPEWKMIKSLCEALHISPGAWLLACAHYNAGLEESRIDWILAGMSGSESDRINPL